MRKERCQLGPFSAEGRTKTEAREALERTLEGALSGSYRPVVVTFRGETMIGYRTPTSGWTSGTAENVAEIRSLACFPKGTTRDDVEHAIRFSLAQRQWDGVETSSPVLAGSPRAQEFERWARWCIEYQNIRAQLEAKGMDRAEAGEIADDIQRGLKRRGDYGLAA